MSVVKSKFTRLMSTTFFVEILNVLLLETNWQFIIIEREKGGIFMRVPLKIAFILQPTITQYIIIVVLASLAKIRYTPKIKSSGFPHNLARKPSLTTFHLSRTNRHIHTSHYIIIKARICVDDTT